MRAILPLLSLGTVAQALYFFIDGTTPKCFFEDLPKDTLVVGHYDAQEFDDRTGNWDKHDGISIYISVEVRSGARFPGTMPGIQESHMLQLHDLPTLLRSTCPSTRTCAGFVTSLQSSMT